MPAAPLLRGLHATQICRRPYERGCVLTWARLAAAALTRRSLPPSPFRHPLPAPTDCTGSPSRAPCDALSRRLPPSSFRAPRCGAPGTGASANRYGARSPSQASGLVVVIVEAGPVDGNRTGRPVLCAVAENDGGSHGTLHGAGHENRGVSSAPGAVGHAAVEDMGADHVRILKKLHVPNSQAGTVLKDGSKRKTQANVG